MTAPPPTSVADLTPAWLSEALGGRVDAVTATRVGTGQIGTCHRLELSGPDVGAGVPATVLAKLPADDPGQRALLAGAYRGEVRFYRELAATLAVRVPRCFHGTEVTDDGAFCLLLEDLAPRVQGDQLAGCGPGPARDAVVNLAGLHGPRWCDPTLLDVEGLALSGPDDAALMAEFYGPATEIFVAGLGDLLDDETVATLEALPDVVGAWSLARSERFGPVHGDYRLDNLMFGSPGDVVALDWQTLSLGLPARDLAFFAGTSLTPEVRRACERDLVAAHHDALLGFGVRDYPLDLAWEDYRFAMVQGPLVTVFGCAYGTRTDRGDRIFAVMATRACAAIRELDTLALIGAAG